MGLYGSSKKTAYSQKKKIFYVNIKDFSQTFCYLNGKHLTKNFQYFRKKILKTSPLPFPATLRKKCVYKIVFLIG